MVELAALTYGVLVSFVLSALTRNHRGQRPNPAMLQVFGYMLCGVSIGACVILSAIALGMAVS
jgi:hypothetical protein